MLILMDRVALFFVTVTTRLHKALIKVFGMFLKHVLGQLHRVRWCYSIHI